MHVDRYERIWLAFGVGMLAVFFAVITTQAIVDGVVPPSRIQTIDPMKVASTPPFDHPGLRQVGPKTYEAYYVAHIFAFEPHHLEIPAGAAVTFYVTSTDVMHGFSIPLTDVNAMVTPGWVSQVSHTFDRPGKYLLVCNEYCGIDHQVMAGDILVK